MIGLLIRLGLYLALHGCHLSTHLEALRLVGLCLHLVLLSREICLLDLVMPLLSGLHLIVHALPKLQSSHVLLLDGVLEESGFRRSVRHDPLRLVALLEHGGQQLRAARQAEFRRGGQLVQHETLVQHRLGEARRGGGGPELLGGGAAGKDALGHRNVVGAGTLHREPHAVPEHAAGAEGADRGAAARVRRPGRRRRRDLARRGRRGHAVHVGRGRRLMTPCRRLRG
mmetsp:Transcript_125205/g.401066  ORF Transcript_125205/g.401066 Transcript_125205/m.401066 type:complete len:227 (-) Transcript_125205:265-945(-)